MNFVEFPKCLYRTSDLTGETCTVSSREEEALFLQEGWLTADDIHAGTTAPEPEKPKKKK